MQCSNSVDGNGYQCVELDPYFQTITSKEIHIGSH